MSLPEICCCPVVFVPECPFHGNLAKPATTPVSIEDANELQDILRTLTNSGTALKTSARGLVAALAAVSTERDTQCTLKQNCIAMLEELRPKLAETERERDVSFEALLETEKQRDAALADNEALREVLRNESCHCHWLDGRLEIKCPRCAALSTPHPGAVKARAISPQSPPAEAPPVP